MNNLNEQYEETNLDEQYEEMNNNFIIEEFNELEITDEQYEEINNYLNAEESNELEITDELHEETLNVAIESIVQDRLEFEIMLYDGFGLNVTWINYEEGHFSAEPINEGEPDDYGWIDEEFDDESDPFGDELNNEFGDEYYEEPNEDNEYASHNEGISEL